jgi:hypothetical protein
MATASFVFTLVFSETGNSNQQDDIPFLFVALADIQYAITLNRCSKLESEIAALPEDKKAARRHDLQKREADFLRLRRTRLSPHDFETLKVIGRGAFGEVQYRARCRAWRASSAHVSPPAAAHVHSLH